MKSDTSLSTSTTRTSATASLRVLHVAECYEAGVGHAVDTIVRIRDQDAHLLLYSGARQPSPHFKDSQPLRGSFLGRILHIRAAVRTHRPDVVHLHSSWAGVYGRMALLKTPIVYQPHCFKFDDPSLSKIKTFAFRNAEKILGRLTKVVLALSVHEADLARGVSPNAECVMLPNTPTIPAASTARAFNSDSTKRVVMVGRLSSQKDPALFARIARIVRETHPDATFTWVGDGETTIRAELDKAGIEITGWLPPADLIELLDSSTCYVHTASYEGFPLSVLDAAARGLPVIARQIPAFEGTGLLQGIDAETLAELTTRVLSDSNFFNDAAERSHRLLNDMNESRQEQALESAYKIARGKTQ